MISANSKTLQISDERIKIDTNSLVVSGSEKPKHRLNHDLDATVVPPLDPEVPHEVLRVATWNTRSFNREKMAAIHERLSRCYDIALLQEVHNPTIHSQRVFNFKVNEDIFISPGTSHKAGVAIYINTANTNIKVDHNSLQMDLEGRIISIQISWFNHLYNLVSRYAPANEDGERSSFFENVLKSGHIIPTMNNIIGGDFNVCLDPSKDMMNYADVSEYIRAHKGSIGTLRGLIAHSNTQDSWRVYQSNFFDDNVLWTWQQGGPSSSSPTRSRLDRIYVSDSIVRSVIHAGTQDTMLSDHRIYEIHLTTPEEHRRYNTGWKFNNQLLEDKAFTGKISSIITRIKEAALLCNTPIEILAKQGELITAIKRVSKRFGRAKAKQLNQHKKDIETNRIKMQQRIHELTTKPQSPREVERLTQEYERVNNELLYMFERNAEAAKVRTHQRTIPH